MSANGPEANLSGQPEIPLACEANSGGGGGIRTHGTRKRPTVFKTAAFDHSATPPTGEAGASWNLASLAEGHVITSLAKMTTGETTMFARDCRV